jgi:hypothetical protein
VNDTRRDISGPDRVSRDTGSKAARTVRNSAEYSSSCFNGSSERFVQVHDFRVIQEWNAATINVKIGWGPNGRQLDPEITARNGHHAAANEVHAKFSDNHGSDLRVAFMGSAYLIWR